MATTSANTRSSFIGACMLCDHSVLIDVKGGKLCYCVLCSNKVKTAPKNDCYVYVRGIYSCSAVIFNIWNHTSPENHHLLQLQYFYGIQQQNASEIARSRIRRRLIVLFTCAWIDTDATSRDAKSPKTTTGRAYLVACLHWTTATIFSLRNTHASPVFAATWLSHWHVFVSTQACR